MKLVIKMIYRYVELTEKWIYKTLSLELKKGYYICSAVYGNAALNNKDYFGQSGQSITISDCDLYSELSNYSNVKGACGSIDSKYYTSIVLSGKSFICSINSAKTINITSNTSNDSDKTNPVGTEVSCTKLDIN